MASTNYTLSATWSATNRYTAVADVDVYLSNPSSLASNWAITADDTVPVISEGSGHPLMPGRGIPMQLKSGERLWLAGSSSNTLEV